MSTIGLILHWQTCEMLPSKETWCDTDSFPCKLALIAMGVFIIPWGMGRLKGSALQHIYRN